MALAPGTQARVAQAFAELCATTSEDEFLDRLFRSPVLLRGDVMQWLLDGIDPAREPDRLDRLAVANEIRTTVNPQDYPTDLGPVEQLWRRVDDGEVTAQQARIAASQLPVTESLMGVYVGHLYLRLTDGHPQRDWHRVRRDGKILLSAMDACAHRDERALRRARLLGVTRWAHFLLIAVPEVALLHLGDAAGREALADAQAKGDPEEIRHMSYELAALWGDPYVADRTSAAYQHEMLAWRRRGAEELGRGEGLDPEAWNMPEPEEALRTSLQFWRMARAAAPTDPTVLIGLAEAASFLSRVIDEEMPADAVTAVHEGAELTDETDVDAVLRYRFVSMQNHLNRR